MSDSKMQISNIKNSSVIIRNLHLICVPLLLILQTTSSSALDNAFTQSPYNYIYLNPAYAGVEGAHVIKQHIRSQWSNTILTTTLSYDHYLDSLNSGIGILIELDQLSDLLKNYKGRFSYAYRINIEKEHHINFGISAGLDYYDWTLRFGPNNPGEGFTSTKVFKTAGDFGAGIFYRFRGLLAGVSISHLYYTEINTNNLILKNFTNSPLYSIIIGYKIQMGSAACFIPTIRYFSQDGRALSDVNTTVELFDRVIIGAAYHENRLAFITGLKLMDQLRLTYSFDYFINLLGSNTAHEFGLRFSPQLNNNSIY